MLHADTELALVVVLLTELLGHECDLPLTELSREVSDLIQRGLVMFANHLQDNGGIVAQSTECVTTQWMSHVENALVLNEGSWEHLTSLVDSL